MIKALITAAVLAAASAAAAAPASNICFRANELGNTRAVDDRTIYARVGIRDVYRLDMVDACPGLKNSPGGIVLDVHGDQTICTPADFDITVRQTGSPCLVRTMTKLSADEAKALPHAAQP